VVGGVSCGVNPVDARPSVCASGSGTAGDGCVLWPQAAAQATPPRHARSSREHSYTVPAACQLPIIELCQGIW
jgi:uncharacterized iron-regulated membrane protein